MVTGLLHIFANTEEAQGIAALGIDPLAILAQAVTFLVLFFIIKKFALEKIVKSLEERRRVINDGVKLGYEMEAERAKLEDKISKQLHDTRGQADKILAEAHKEAGEVIKAAEDVAVRKTDAMIADARAQIEEDIKRARKDLEKETLQLVIEATEAVIRKKIDAKQDAVLLEQALKEVGSS